MFLTQVLLKKVKAKYDPASLNFVLQFYLVDVYNDTFLILTETYWYAWRVSYQVTRSILSVPD